jgi:hypothetical protein
MARFKRNPKTFKLTFETDDQLNGLVVQIRSVPVEEFLKLTDLAATPMDDPESAKSAREIIRVLAGQLAEWNLDDEFDDPVPATYEGLVKQELDFVMKIFSSWIQAMSGVGSPLPTASNGGETSLELSIPMDVSSPNQTS